jgi:hypothetical protein
MTATIGRQAAFTSWVNSELLVANLCAESAEVLESSEQRETTNLGDTSRGFTLGIPSATANLSFRWPKATPITGSAGIVKVNTGSFYEDSNDLIIGMVGYTLNLQWGALETTSHSDASLAKTYLPGILQWSGTIDLRLDDAKALENAQSVVDSPLGMEFRLDGTRTFTGSAWIGSVSHGATINATNTQTFGFSGTGALTAVGTGNIFAAGAIPFPTAQSMVLTYAPGRTVTGSAFPSEVSIRVARDELIAVDVTAQYTGALTKA